jgi:hypothetical protein
MPVAVLLHLWVMLRLKCRAMAKENIETINELKIWIEGRFDLVAQSQHTTEENMKVVRQRVHDLSGDIAKIAAMDFANIQKTLEEHDAKIEGFSRAAYERKGAIAALRATYAVGGALVGLAASVIFDLARFFHP